MKNFTNLISFCFAVLLLTSCAARVAYLSRSERVSSSFSGNTSIVESALKSSNTSKSSVANSSLLNTSGTSSISGFLIGIYFTEIELGEKFELQPEVDFLLVKDLNEIQVPVLIKYNVADEFSVLAGPNAGYLLDAPTGLKSFNFGVDFGVAYDVGEKFNINARYGLGLSNLLENAGGSSLKLSGFQVGFGYQF